MARRMSVAPRRKATKAKARKPKTWSQTTIGDIGNLLVDAGVAAARRFLNVEVHQFDNQPGTLTPGAAGTIGPISYIAQGDDYNNRQGNSVRTVSIETRLTVYVTAGGFQDNMRYILFADMENAGATPAVTDVLEAASPRSPFNHLNTKRFVILHDEIISVSTVGNATQSRVIKQPLDVHLFFSAAAGAVASGREGALHFLLVADVTGATPSTALHHSRVSFIDN